MFKSVFCILLYSVFAGCQFIEDYEGSRIIGGEPIQITQAPYQVSLRDHLKVHFCGGTIIHEEFVLSAAQCFPDLVYIVAGITDIKEIGEKYIIKKRFIHEKNKDTPLENDVGLLQVTKKFAFSDKIQKIDLVPSNLKIPDGEPFAITGWGFTKEGPGPGSNTLLQATVNKFNQKKCLDIYDYLIDPTENIFCASAKGKDTCEGDIGGPITMKKNGLKLAGVASFKAGCARPDFPGVYASVATFREWIDDTIQTALNMP